MSSRVTLNGITWNHTRGVLPAIATAQRYSELQPNVEIVWEKRSLQSFADHSVDDLAKNYDLLIVDHPFIANIAKAETLIPLDEWLPSSFLFDQAENSVGHSHVSYSFAGHQWALAIDAATPVASWREDILQQLNVPVPCCWDDLMALAAQGRVAIPGIPLDTLMNFYMFCSALGEDPFTSGRVVQKEIGVAALLKLREILSLCAPENRVRNPIATYEAMTLTDNYAYCPWGYGYSNYARRGYANNRLRFGKGIEIAGQSARSTLGGTGIGISARCKHREIATCYAQFVANPRTQKTIYFDSGGQPGHRSAWLDEHTNNETCGFFRNTLASLDNAWLRPRNAQYIQFQDQAGPIVSQCVWAEVPPAETLIQLEALFAKTMSS